MKFICPECRQTARVICETQTATAVRFVQQFENGEIRYSYPEQTNESWDVFKCSNCSTEIKFQDGGHVTDEGMLLDWYENDAEKP